MEQSIYRRRIITNRVGMILSTIAMAAGLMGLTWILWTLLYNGLSAFNYDFFFASTPAPGSAGGGMANAIVGSLMMVGVSTLVATPIGILAGIYLAEYGARSRFAEATRFVVDIMLSAPSIVIGLFVYAIAVATVGHFSGWAGSIAPWTRASCSSPLALSRNTCAVQAAPERAVKRVSDTRSTI